MRQCIADRSRSMVFDGSCIIASPFVLIFMSIFAGLSAQNHSPILELLILRWPSYNCVYI